MESHVPYYLPSPLNMLAANVSFLISMRHYSTAASRSVFTSALSPTNSRSAQSIQHADYVVPVEIEYHWHNVYVIKRPGVDNFLKKMGELYEIVVFTASLSKVPSPYSISESGFVRC